METRPEQNRIRAQAIIGIPRDHTILIVEDNEERIDYFKRWMRPEDGNFNNVTVARTPQEALVILRGFRFDKRIEAGPGGWVSYRVRYTVTLAPIRSSRLRFAPA